MELLNPENTEIRSLMKHVAHQHVHMSVMYWQHYRLNVFFWSIVKNNNVCCFFVLHLTIQAIFIEFQQVTQPSTEGFFDHKDVQKLCIWLLSNTGNKRAH